MLFRSKPNPITVAPRPGVPMTDPVTIAPELLDQQTEESVRDLARRLENEDYDSVFDSLADWHLMRAIAIHRPELARPWVHLVDQEPFDED